MRKLIIVIENNKNKISQQINTLIKLMAKFRSIHSDKDSPEIMAYLASRSVFANMKLALAQQGDDVMLEDTPLDSHGVVLSYTDNATFIEDLNVKNQGYMRLNTSRPYAHKLAHINIPSIAEKHINEASLSFVMRNDLSVADTLQLVFNTIFNTLEFNHIGNIRSVTTYMTSDNQIEKLSRAGIFTVMTQAGRKSKCAMVILDSSKHSTNNLALWHGEVRISDFDSQYTYSFDRVARTEVNRIAIVREPTHFSIDTDDNPFMNQTIRNWEHQARELAMAAYETQGISTDKELFVSEMSKAYVAKEKEKIKQIAISQHQSLTRAYRKHGIIYFTLLPEKGKLTDGSFGHKTDEVFATDTGQYFFDHDRLNYIPGNFANPQRFGEERLAVTQAVETLRAKMSVLQDSHDYHRFKFEGGDIRQAPGRKLFFIGHGHRNEPGVVNAIENVLGSEYTVVPIELLQPKYYHVDCCFLPLFDDNALIYEGEYQRDEMNNIIYEKIDRLNPNSGSWPAIITETATMTYESRKAIWDLYGESRLILITEQEAANFCANAVLMRTTETQEKNVMFFPLGSLSQTTKNSILRLVSNAVIEEIRFDALHLSGGSIRCSTQEVPCSVEYVNALKERMNVAADDCVRSHSFFKRNMTNDHKIVDSNNAKPSVALPSHGH